jgi:salicylate hydroxylase
MITGDLVIAADGVHSPAVESVLGRPNPALPVSEDNFIYRFLIPTAVLKADPVTAELVEYDGCMRVYLGENQRLAWYPCRDNEIQNFGLLHRSKKSDVEESWHTPIETSKLLEQAKEFHPRIRAVLEKAEDAKQWPLLFRPPIPVWFKDKVVLVGDAAHPMLPRETSRTSYVTR